MPKYYGQFEPPTDAIIEQYFPGERSGVCVEVGASHGIAASNTKYFEDIGWTCLCIEPNPDLYMALKRNRKLTYNYAIGERNEDKVPFAVVELVGGDTTAISGLEIDQELFKAHQVNAVREIKVDLKTLDYCLEKSGITKLDFVSIDTEGTELNVLKGFDLKKYNPTLLILEDNKDTKVLDKYLRKFGYKRDRRHGVNNFYVAKHYYSTK